MKPEEAIEILQKRIDLIKQDWPHMLTLWNIRKHWNVQLRHWRSRSRGKFHTRMWDMTSTMMLTCTPAYARRADCISLIFQTTMLILNVTVITQKICFIPVWYIMRILV